MSPSKPKAVGVYVRVSTIGSNEAGQRREIKAWLDGQATEGVNWYVDKESCDTLERPAFERL